MAHLRGQAEDLLDQLLGLRGFLEEQLDDGGQQSELDLRTEDATSVSDTHATRRRPNAVQ